MAHRLSPVAPGASLADRQPGRGLVWLPRLGAVRHLSAVPRQPAFLGRRVELRPALPDLCPAARLAAGARLRRTPAQPWPRLAEGADGRPGARRFRLQRVPAGPGEPAAVLRLLPCTRG